MSSVLPFKSSLFELFLNKNITIQPFTISIMSVDGKVPVTDEIRMTVVGSPAYFARRSLPRHPRELVEHECLNWHQSASTPAYRWEFTEPGTTRGREFTVVVPARGVSPRPCQ